MTTCTRYILLVCRSCNLNGPLSLCIVKSRAYDLFDTNYFRLFNLNYSKGCIEGQHGVMIFRGRFCIKHKSNQRTGVQKMTQRSNHLPVQAACILHFPQNRYHTAVFPRPLYGSIGVPYISLGR